MTRDGRRLLKNRGRALDEGAAPWARVAARWSNVPSIHIWPACTWPDALGQMHLAVKSYLVAGERYRLSPHGSNPRCFLRSFAWNAGFLPKSPESNRIDVNFLSLNPYDRRAFTLSLDDFVYQNCS